MTSSPARRHRARLKAALFEAQDGICALCFERMNPPCSNPSRTNQPLSATLEHIFPLVMGGRDATAVAAHWECNQAKRNRRPTGCELLALDWVRTKVRSSARCQLLVDRALESLAMVAPQRIPSPDA
jgi:5-methylcytosine-specific restriction endonuclease McrA